MQDTEISLRQRPFRNGEVTWANVYKTPWYSMYRRSDWFCVGPTSGLTPACVLVLDSEDNVLLLEVYRPSIDRISLETPRGFAEAGETLEMTARREVLEETGIDVMDGDVTDLGRVYPDTGVLTNVVGLFVCRLNAPFKEIEIQDDEILGYRITHIDEYERLIDAGHIRDGVGIAAMKRYRAGNICHEGEIAEITYEIKILDADGKQVTTISTHRPDWSFQQYCRNRDTVGWVWQFKK